MLPSYRPGRRVKNAFVIFAVLYLVSVYVDNKHRDKIKEDSVSQPNTSVEAPKEKKEYDEFIFENIKPPPAEVKEEEKEETKSKQTDDVTTNGDDVKKSTDDASKSSSETPKTSSDVTKDAEHVTKENSDTIVQDSTVNSTDPDKPKLILIWGDFLDVQPGTVAFKMLKCPHVCNFTYDKSTLPYADSVVVYPFHMFSDLAEVKVPKRYSQKQIFLFYFMENPGRSKVGLSKLPYDDLFNLTMTYLDSPDTDLYNPYAKSEARPSKVSRNVLPHDQKISSKSKNIVWLLSNCGARSARYEYAKELAKHIDVDIFGKCGNDTCKKGSLCAKRLSSTYRFYLAFENGHCTDYITEKAWRTLRETDLVPIVLGGGDYAKSLPERSYIDVKHYESPQKLAEYLKTLSLPHSYEYKKYFLWRLSHSIKPIHNIRYENLCKYCTILNTPGYPYKSRFDPQQYWNPGVCLNQEQERKVYHLE